MRGVRVRRRNVRSCTEWRHLLSGWRSCWKSDQRRDQNVEII